MIATRPVSQVQPGDTIQGISVHKVIHKGAVISEPYPHVTKAHIVVHLACEDHGPEELVVLPGTLANVERKR